MDNDRIILGIDPGTTFMGYGVLRVRGNHAELIDLGAWDLHKVKNHYMSLMAIFKFVTEVIEKYLPDELAIEAPFYGKNVQSMLKLGRAQGVAITVAVMHDIPITEYAPLKIKMALTGSGRATKEQVADMLKRILNIPKDKMPEKLDATDGLAAAYCHFLQKDLSQGKNKYSTWGDFAKRNQTKVSGQKKSPSSWASISASSLNSSTSRSKTSSRSRSTSSSRPQSPSLEETLSSHAANLRSHSSSRSSAVSAASLRSMKSGVEESRTRQKGCSEEDMAPEGLSKEDLRLRKLSLEDWLKEFGSQEPQDQDSPKGVKGAKRSTSKGLNPEEIYGKKIGGAL